MAPTFSREPLAGRLGLVQTCRPVPSTGGSPRLHAFAPCLYGSTADDPWMAARGFGLSATDARAACLGELAERYASRDVPAPAPFEERTSTGCAAHRDLARALVAGLCEVIERDALMTMWLRRMPVHEVTAEPGSRLDERLGALRAAGARVTLFDLASDLGAQAAFAVAVPAHGSASLMGLGSAAHTSPSVAFAKAALEAGACLAYVARLRAAGVRAERSPFARRVLRLQEDPAPLKALLRRDRRTVAADVGSRSPQEDLRALVAALRDRGLAPSYRDLTTRELSAAGYVCVQTAIDGAIPMPGVETAEPRWPPRTYRPLPGALPARGPDELNPIPHPFP